MSKSKIEIANRVLAEVRGNQYDFIKKMVEEHGFTKPAAYTYYFNAVSAAMGSPVTKRTIVVVIEVDIDETEDAHETAVLAVDLLGNHMTNQITLASVGDKVNG